MSATLTALSNRGAYRLGDFNLIGRGEHATIRLDDGEVSRQHATIRRDGANYWVVDVGSANGSYVNDVALTTARVLHTGDRVQFGRSIFLFDQGTTAPDPDSQVANTKTQWGNPAAPKSRPATLFVADLKEFTGISARLSPEQVAALLAEWYMDCNMILKHYGASIDKFIGDCVFAYWHETAADVCVSAVQAAQALRAAEDAATSPTRVLVREQQDIVLDCRIGLHVGEVAIGAMGKGINTALGDAVNLAFRIEGLTRKLDKPLLVSAQFVEHWPEGRHYFESCGYHEVKGRAEMIEVFSLK
ncbi:adenylate/guanylate cyclase domain-containing protein [Mesorhizobium sp.]|uniref:adenylate/guanylate cyclase domain-containing protein n=1 Tax=Mesorhizobium sp. TaxID=1871066 RepID=UPI002579C14A|nr:adenylate/guanylate cyclase domain-containing protein [Mesorhizobium sp.]